MKLLLILCLSVACFRRCHADEVVAEYNSQALAHNGEMWEGEDVLVDGRRALKIVNTNRSALRARLLRIEAPRISGMLYALRGEVKYDKVEGDGFLEMWSYFTSKKPGLPPAKYFSRTLGDSGEMAKITATSNWRKFLLPFNRGGAETPPTQLELNLVLPGSGAVYVSSLQLVQFAGSSFSQKGGSAWWSDRMSGFLGGAAGSLLGCLGSLLEWKASKGKSRGFVLNLTRLLIGFGVILAVGGVAAILIGQPYGVWMVLILVGVIDLAILPHRLARYQRHYQEIELRKMTAADALKI